MNPVIEELENKSLLKDSEGARVVFLDEYDMPPCIIVTSAGTTIYARYLTDLAQSFSNFYNANRIIGEETNVENARLYLTKAVGDVIRNCMALLGIEMPNRM